MWNSTILPDRVGPVGPVPMFSVPKKQGILLKLCWCQVWHSGFITLGKLGGAVGAVEECGWNCWSYEDFTTKKTKTWCWHRLVEFNCSFRQELIFLLFQQRDAGKDPCVFNPAPAETSHITCSIWSDLAVLRFALRSASREIVYKDLDELISTTWDLSKSVDETLA